MMTDVPRITLDMLRGACKEQRDIFRAEWPEGAEVSVENAFRAQELGLSLLWGERWFTAAAEEAYREATSQSREAYLEDRDTVLEVYDEAIARDEAIATAWKVYDESTSQSREAHRKAIATAWVAAYLQSVAEREAAK
jgi:hypothetical protein